MTLCPASWWLMKTTCSIFSGQVSAPVGTAPAQGLLIELASVNLVLALQAHLDWTLTQVPTLITTVATEETDKLVMQERAREVRNSANLWETGGLSDINQENNNSVHLFTLFVAYFLLPFSPGSDRHNFLEMASSELNFPVPFENSTFWDMVRLI